ncbi:hypothetical protein, partial [Burkholderia ubonensis]|uniref:hypothetical protein n=1 Tax=Burkholderia ubonensis TaxID=101571 RepID=UPI001E31D149
QSLEHPLQDRIHALLHRSIRFHSDLSQAYQTALLRQNPSGAATRSRRLKSRLRSAHPPASTST